LDAGPKFFQRQLVNWKKQGLKDQGFACRLLKTQGQKVSLIDTDPIQTSQT